jgi:glycosyltransferase involved in cell wall biosynthesis
MKKISIMTPCFNEEGNVRELIERIRKVMEEQFDTYHYEHILIDNASTDDTVKILKELALEDNRIKIIVNSRNFGHIKSPAYGLFQATGDAVITMVSDLQDPPELIPELIRKWEAGADMVLAVRKSSQEHKAMYKVRELYYALLQKLSEVKIYKNFTGFGLYDRKVVKALKSIDDPYPFLRGMISEVGYSVDTIQYDQPIRLHGVTKNNFYTLYDIGVLGILNYSKIPLRLAIFLGAIIAVLSTITGCGYLITKLIQNLNLKCNFLKIS